LSFVFLGLFFCHICGIHAHWFGQPYVVVTAFSEQLLHPVTGCSQPVLWCLCQIAAL